MSKVKRTDTVPPAPGFSVSASQRLLAPSPLRSVSVSDWPALRAELAAHTAAHRGSAAELARRLGVDRRQVSLWLRSDGPEPRYSIGKAIERWLVEQ